MAYMRMGESDFDTLKYIFQEGIDSESGLKDNKVIEVSSDIEADQLNDGVLCCGHH